MNLHFNLKIQLVPHREHCPSLRKTLLLMPRRKMIAVYCKDHKGQINRMCEQKAEILVLKLAVPITATVRFKG